MLGNETIPFEHEGNEYEIRIISDGFTTRVRVFLDGKPANGYSYSVDSNIAFGLRRALGVNALDNLINDAKNDIINNTWQRYVEAINKTTE